MPLLPERLPKGGSRLSPTRCRGPYPVSAVLINCPPSRSWITSRQIVSAN